MTSKKMYLLFRKSVFLSHHTTVEEDGPVSYFSLITSNKLVIARQPRAVCQIFLLFLRYCCYFTRLKAGKYNANFEKLGKYLPYCTRDRAITIHNANHTNLFFKLRLNRIYLLSDKRKYT